MIRVGALLSILLVAGCSTLPGGADTSLQIAGVGPVSLTVVDIPEAPAEARSALEAAFAAEASARDIGYAPGQGGTVRIYGYVSFAPSSLGTLVVYVFDFVDPSGNRIARISGQASATATPADPWDVIDGELAMAIVDSVIDRFLAEAGQINVGV